MKKLLLILLGLGFFSYNTFSQEKGGSKSSSERKVKSNVGSNKTSKDTKKKGIKSKKRKSDN